MIHSLIHYRALLPVFKPFVLLAYTALGFFLVWLAAGRGIPALGLHAVGLAERFPGARLILAHAAICDLSWIWRVAPDYPNLLFDSAWWLPSDMLTLFSLIPNTTPRAALIQPPMQIVTPRTASPPAALPQLPPPPPEPPRQQVVAVPPIRPPTSPPVLPTPTKTLATLPTSHVQTKQAVNMRSAPDNTSPVVRIVLQGAVMTAFAKRWTEKGGSTPSTAAAGDFDRLPRIINALSSAELVVGMRLHALILAAGAGVPSLALSYDPKVRSFMQFSGQEDAVVGRQLRVAAALDEALADPAIALELLDRDVDETVLKREAPGVPGRERLAMIGDEVGDQAHRSPDQPQPAGAGRLEL